MSTDIPGSRISEGLKPVRGNFENPATRDRVVNRRQPQKWSRRVTTGPMDSSSEQPQHSLACEQCRLETFRRFGSSTMAFATLQPGMQYFESHSGYLAFDSSLGVTFVLGDPIAPPECHEALIDDFLSSRQNVVFCQISKPTARILSKRNWYVNDIGSDMELDLANYDFDGPKKAKLRQAAHKIEREGYRIQELPTAQINQTSLKELCSKWIATRSIRHEARFLVRPFDFGPDPGVRKFFLFDSTERLTAFVIFDPICFEGHVLGYSPSVKRRADWSPVGAEEAITKFAIERFREEKISFLRMGLLPLFDIGLSDFRDAWPLRKTLQCLYRYGNQWIFNFKGHADFKHRYRGELMKSYLATERRWGNVYRLIALLRVCNFF